MRLTDIQEIKQKETAMSIDINGVDNKFNVLSNISSEDSDAFVSLVTYIVVFNDGYHPELLVPALRRAEVEFFTDIDLTDADDNAIYDFVMRTDISSMIENVADIEQISALSVASKEMIRYALDVSSAKHQLSTSLVDIIDKLSGFTDILNKFGEAINVDGVEIDNVLSGLQKLNNMREDKIVEYVLNKE